MSTVRQARICSRWLRGISASSRPFMHQANDHCDQVRVSPIFVHPTRIRLTSHAFSPMTKNMVRNRGGFGVSSTGVRREEWPTCKLTTEWKHHRSYKAYPATAPHRRELTNPTSLRLGESIAVLSSRAAPKIWQARESPYLPASSISTTNQECFAPHYCWSHVVLASNKDRSFRPGFNRRFSRMVFFREKV